MISCCVIGIFSLIITTQADSAIPADSLSVPDSLILHINRDSLYYTLRIQTLRNSTLTQSQQASLGAAQELASEGLFSDAVLMLKEIDSSGTEKDVTEEGKGSPVTAVSPLKTAAVESNPVTWRVYTSGDYSRITDLTPEQQHSDSASLLLADSGLSPYSGYMRAGLDYTHQGKIKSKISPDFIVSDRKTNLQVAAEMSAFNEILSAGATVRGEKVFKEDYISDNADALVKIEGCTRGFDWPVSFSLPFTLEVLKFRKNFSMNYSYKRYSVLPVIGWTSGNMKWDCILSGEAGYLDAELDTADMIFTHPGLAVDFWAQALSLGIEPSFLYEKFTHYRDPSERISFETDIRSGIKFVPALELTVDGVYNQETEHHYGTLSTRHDTLISLELAVDTTFTVVNYDSIRSAYTLRGQYIQTGLELKLHINETAALGIGYDFEWRRYPPLYSIGSDILAEPVYLWESYRRDTPKYGVLISTTGFDAEYWVDYQMEKYSKFPGVTYAVHNGSYFGFSSRISWQAISSISVDFSIDYQNKRYMSASLGLNCRF